MIAAITSTAPAKGITAFLQSSRSQNWLLGLLLVAAVIMAYQPVWHAGFIWDDDDYIIKNKLLTAPDGLKRIWFSLDSPSQYFPLTYTSFRVERALWGLNPTGYHWVNILLHATNALLVWWLLRRLAVPGAWLAAAIFALHPVQVESVAWITERKNVLSLFFLLALLAWVRFVEDQPKRLWHHYGLALIFYVLALCSKTTACTLPATMLLVLWLKGWPITRVRLVQIVPFILLGVGMGLVTMWWERFHQGTQGKAFSLGLLDRILVASHSVWFYAGKLAWPTNLTFSYPRWVINPSDPLAYVWLLAGVGMYVMIYFARRFTGRGVEVAVLFYVATLSPILGFIMLYTFIWSFVADHYQYVASIGPLALASTGIIWALDTLKSRWWLKPVFCGGLLLILGVLTWRQSDTYVNLETLWRTTITRNPSSWLATYNLGTTLAQKGELDEAITNLQKAVEIKPDFAMAHYNLGDILLHNGRVDEAIDHFQKANQSDPNLPLVHYELANALIKKGMVDEGIAEFKKTLELNPDYADAHRFLGIALLYYKNQPDEAIEQFQEVLAANPEYAEANNFLGIALLQKGRQSEAAANFQLAVEHRPHYVLAENNLAWLLATSSDAKIRNDSKAVELAEDADQHSNGQNPMVMMTLAAAYAEAKRFPEAIATTQRAIKLAESQNNTGLASTLQTQIGFYRAGVPFRMPSQTGAPTQSAKP